MLIILANIEIVVIHCRDVTRPISYPCTLLLASCIFACCGWCCKWSLHPENASYFACFEMPNYQPRMTQRGHFFVSTKILFARPSRFYGQGQEQSGADFPLHNARLMANCQVFVLAAVSEQRSRNLHVVCKSCCYALDALDEHLICMFRARP